MKNLEYMLEMDNISKEFPGVKALDGANLKVRPHSVHALMGENGAGKSTLMKCLFGIYEKDNGKILFEENLEETNPKGYSVDRSILSVSGICQFVQEVDQDILKDLLNEVVCNNTSIAKEGLEARYGNEVARTIYKYYGEDNIYARLKAMGAAGSDARMGGCPYPVVTVVGSGNQGMTCTLPVVEYAHYKNVSEDKLHRALALALLISIHQKTGIGRLSAYCGAVSASCGAACGLTYLEKGADLEAISQTITNTLAVASGIVCDGAKPSCAKWSTISNPYL